MHPQSARKTALPTTCVIGLCCTAPCHPASASPGLPACPPAAAPACTPGGTPGAGGLGGQGGENRASTTPQRRHRQAGSPAGARHVLRLQRLPARQVQAGWAEAETAQGPERERCRRGLPSQPQPAQEAPHRSATVPQCWKCHSQRHSAGRSRCSDTLPQRQPPGQAVGCASPSTPLLQALQPTC